MSESMVERVARAMFEASALQNEQWPNDTNPAQAFWTRIARAAIEAMREPTEEMVEAAAFEAGFDIHTTGEAVAVWRAMIDVAKS